MDWTTIIASCVPAIAASAVSYFIARYQGKNDLKKATQDSNAAIERLMKQHEIDIASLREQHKMEMESKEKEHEHKLQIMQKEYELRVAESKTIKNDDIINNVAAGFLQSFLKNPEEGAKTLDALNELKDKFDGIK